MGSNKDKRDEHRRQRKRMRDTKNEREQSRRQRNPAWPTNSPVASRGLREFAAPSIEAAGSLQNALRLGIIGGSPDMVAELHSLTPASRGGSLKRPDAERQWQRAVKAGLRAQGKSLEAVKRLVEWLSRNR